MFHPIQQSDETMLIRSLKQKMETISTSRCIFKVRNDTTFVPKLISIGPYHYESLKVMEEHKWKYSFTFLTRKPNIEARLEKCIKGLKELEHRARLCYDDEMNHLTSEEFVEIMLIDGCFVIELLLRYCVKTLRRRQGDDPFFGLPGKISMLRLDMTMVANQIPYFVLQMLFSLVPIPEQCTMSLNELAFRFFKHIIPGDNSGLRDKFSHHGDHFLDMIRSHLLPVTQNMTPKATNMPNCATNLKKSGLILKENTEHSSALLDIKFTKNNVIQIPHLKIHQQTEALLQNLIKFEQCCIKVGDTKPAYIGSYALLMRNMMCSEKDVRLLEKKGVLTSYMTDRNAIVDMFQRLCDGIELQQNLYGQLCEQVNGYKKKKWIQLGSIFKGKASSICVPRNEI